MKFDLFGFSLLPSPVTTANRTYTIVNNPEQKPDFIGNHWGRHAFAVIFRAPGGGEVQLRFHDHNDSTARSSLWVYVDGILMNDGVTFHGRTLVGTINDTKKIADQTLRALVESALADLTALERDLDPAVRHPGSKPYLARQTAEKTARQKALDRL